MAKKKRDITKDEAIAKLWEMGELSWKLNNVQKELKKIFDNDTTKTSVVVVSRRTGKCIIEGTMVKTSKGPKRIEDIKIGDIVYGYDSDGVVRPTPVLNVVDQGIKDVVDLVHNGNVVSTCTKDHRWMTYNIQTKKETVKRIKHMNTADRIRREFYHDTESGIYFKDAYALGALLGDGCSRQKGKGLYISSESYHIPEKIANTLNCNFYKNPSNYTWNLTYGKKLPVGKYDRSTDSIKIEYYNEWARGRYAHEKIVDIEVIRNWNRLSKLNFLAGLIDTDGSVFESSNILNINFTNTSKSLVEAVRWLLLDLFQYEGKIKIDTRKDRDCYYISIRNNLFSKMIVKELSEYLVLDRKKWKEEYKDLPENNTNKHYIGFKIENERKAQTYDISIGNDTHLYLLANGLITHNTYWLVVEAIMQCLKKPNSVVKFLFPQQKDAKTNILPLVRMITEDCPRHLKPVFNSQDKTFNFANGSQIQLAGSNAGNVESIRGGFADLCIIDEASYVTDLKYAVRSVLSPTIRTTGGRIIMASTPGPDPTHEFITEFMIPYKAAGRLKVFTLYDNPNFTPEIIEEIIADDPLGIDSPDFRREYLCEIAMDESSMICPEFSKNKPNIVISDYKVPEFRDFYVGCDVGFRDLTIAIFGYYNFNEACLYITDEYVINGPEMTTQRIADDIRMKERLNFSYNGEEFHPYLRIMDNELKLINDLAVLHNIRFVPAKKDNREGAINEMRMWISQGRVKIHEKCRHLIYHLEYGQWNKSRSDFQRLADTPDKSIKGGHVDGIPALYYLIRNVQASKNPYPFGYGININENTFMSPNFRSKNISQTVDFMRKIMNIKKE